MDWLVCNVVLTLISGLLVFVVVKIALKKPLKIFPSISPVEAMNYTGVSGAKQHKELKHITPETLAKSNLSINRKKNRMTVVSLSVSGSTDYNDIGTEGIIINQYRVMNSDLNYNEIKTGDIMTFQFHSNNKVIEKDFRVIGIAHFPSTGLFYATPEVIESISPYDSTSHLSIFCSAESKPFVQTKLQQLVAENTDLRLMVYSEEFTFTKYAMQVYTNGLYGVSIFVIFFGLINMINMLINSALVRKREFALLQAVGMTNIQLRKMSWDFILLYFKCPYCQYFYLQYS